MRVAVCPSCRVLHEVVNAEILQDATEERRYELTHCRLCETPSRLFRRLEPELPELGPDEFGYPAAVLDVGEAIPPPAGDPPSAYVSDQKARLSQLAAFMQTDGFAQLLHALDQLGASGGSDWLCRWLTQPAFGLGATPMDLIGEPGGVDLVEAHLRRVILNPGGAA